MAAEYAVFNGATGIVGSKEPNNWGLYDMVGLLWQWCLDMKDGTRNPDDVFTPATIANQDIRKVRGGTSTSDATQITSTTDSQAYATRVANKHNDKFGVRIAYIVK